MIKYYLIISVLMSAVSFTIFAIDKRRAKAQKWRIPEKSLFLSAIFFGGLGAFLGMILLRHKTRHLKFQIGLTLILIIQIVIGIIIAMYF